MKPFAILLIILCIAALVGVGYLFVSANLSVTGIGCVATDALDASETFQSMIGAVAADTFAGTVFTAPDAADPAQYQFLTYTVRLKNNTFLPALAVELQISPMEGDVLQPGDTMRHDLAARSEGDFQVTLLTRKEMHNVREITVTWYFWGMPFSLRTAYRPAAAP